MEEIFEVTAKTVSEAYAKANELYGGEDKEISCEIVSEPKKGIFGIGSKDAVIRVHPYATITVGEQENCSPTVFVTIPKKRKNNKQAKTRKKPKGTRKKKTAKSPNAPRSLKRRNAGTLTKRRTAPRERSINSRIGKRLPQQRKSSLARRRSPIAITKRPASARTR